MAVETKYDILSKYKTAGTPERILDTWTNLGGTIIGPDSRTFIKDMVYRVQLGTGSGMDQAIILCEVSLYNTDPLDWVDAVVTDDTQGFFSFTHSVITPHFRLLLLDYES